MSDTQTQEKELTLQEKLAQVNGQLNNLRSTEAACNELLKDKNIRITNLADESDDPLSLTITGNAVTTVVRPILQGVVANKEQLVAIKEQILAAMEQDLTPEKK